MDNEILFSETQKFNQWWLWLILLSFYGLIIFVVIIVVASQKSIDKPLRNLILVLAAVLIIFPAILFLNFKLETEIRRDGVYVKFFPFHLSFKEYKWSEITKSFVRQYNPIEEFGGWGFRIGPYGKAFNVSGNKGLQLQFNDGKRLLIGTNKPSELTEVLKTIGKLKT